MSASLIATAKAAVAAVNATWQRGALFLWCLTTACVALLIALLVGAFMHFGDAAALLANYGMFLVLGTIACATFAGFKTYGEITRRPQQLSLIAQEQESLWSQSKQTSGQTITHLSLHFQATNVTDGSIMLSAVRLKRPWVRYKHILQTTVLCQAHRGNPFGQFPIAAHALTRGAINVVIDGALGGTKKHLYVAVRIQDHAGQWRRLIYPHLRRHGP